MVVFVPNPSPIPRDGEGLVCVPNPSPISQGWRRIIGLPSQFITMTTRNLIAVRVVLVTCEDWCCEYE